MTSSSGVTYKALIIVRLPGSEESAQAEVLLTPADPVALRNGQVKPLRDCTLGELQEFAEDLESDLWAEFHSRTLVELLQQEGEVVTITVVDNEGQPQLLDDDMLDHALVFQPEAISPPDDVPDLLAEAEVEVLDSGEPEEEAHADAPTGLDEVLSDQDEVGKPPVVEEAPAEPETPEEPKATAEPDLQAEIVETPPAIRERPLRILGRRRPLNHPTWTAVDILINEPAFRDAQAHAISSPDREVAGILIGPPPEKQPDNRYLVHISDIIIAKYTKMHGASVTYTPESWRYLTDRLLELYPDESAVIVGWYHTHPGFGIFLSSMDQFIHRHFFTQIWHVALVLDPLAQRSGFFCWDRKHSNVDAYEFPWPHWAANSW
jgi:proteasome lid subunit RPN8/RPN11